MCVQVEGNPCAETAGLREALMSALPALTELTVSVIDSADVDNDIDNGSVSSSTYDDVSTEHQPDSSSQSVAVDSSSAASADGMSDAAVDHSSSLSSVIAGLQHLQKMYMGRTSEHSSQVAARPGVEQQ